MVAFAGPDPIGVLIGAKRPSATLVHKIAVHPDHQRQGHGRHLLASLASKLAILGPPRIIAEVPEARVAARALFGNSGYVEETVLTDYVLQRETGPAHHIGLLIPVTVDDLAANDLLSAHAQTSWERSVETLSARKDQIRGLAVASEERIEAYILYIGREGEGLDIVALRSLVDDEGARLNVLLDQVRARTGNPIRFLKVHPAEIPARRLEALGFLANRAHLLYAGKARAA